MDKETRRRVIERDGPTCYLCGSHLTPNSITLDHVIPQAYGGMDAEDNLRPCCRPCNMKKGAKHPAGWIKSKPLVYYSPDELQNEEWIPVIHCEGLYEVSNLGRVRRVKPASSTFPGRILRPAIYGKGYPGVSLPIDGKMKKFRIHVLVARAFLGPRPAGYEIDHRDTDKRNNRVWNLEYLTRAEHFARTRAAGLMPSGEKHSAACKASYLRRKVSARAKLAIPQVLEIRNSNERSSVLARRFNVAKATIKRIRNGSIWRHI